MQPCIVYLLHATVQVTNPLNGKSPERRTVIREIFLTPLSTATPHLEIQDFPGEYDLLSKRNLRQRFWNTVLGMLEVSSFEPPALNMVSTALLPSTVGLLCLTFHPLDGSATLASPLDGDILVQSAILAKTFYSTEPMFKEHPTSLATKESRVMNVHKQRLSSECRMLRSHTWRRDRLPDGETIGNESSCYWTTTMEVPIYAPKDVPPTFVSVLAARRYMLRLEVRAERCYHLPIILHLPLQIIFEPSGNTMCPTD